MLVYGGRHVPGDVLQHMYVLGHDGAWPGYATRNDLVTLGQGQQGTEITVITPQMLGLRLGIHFWAGGCRRLGPFASREQAVSGGMTGIKPFFPVPVPYSLFLHKFQ